MNAPMQRRAFLQATLASATATLLQACSGEDGADESLGSRFNEAELERNTGYFPQSIASGDPRPRSIVLWTRVADDERDESRASVWLQLARDEAFTRPVALDGSRELELVARRRFDHCVKARITDLEPGTTYYYRFVYEAERATVTSRVGRFRTAPGSESDVTVRFGVMSCQDYVGRYYHALAHAAKQDWDFFLHLGDYVYETTPADDTSASERRVRFRDPDAALPLSERYSADGELEGEATYLAAQSLDNYRDLYRTVRSDRKLQRLHESTAMIAIPDDHEFANDAHGQTATYFNGLRDELSPERRKNADQAWFEYMPVDYADDPEFVFDRDVAFPDDLRVYRDFRFGKHVHVVMTDLRRYRADHVIPEGAFPAAIALDAPALEQLDADVDALQGLLRPYVVVADKQPSLPEALASVLEAEAAAIPDWQQPLDATYINDLVTRYNEANPDTALDPMDVEALPRGIPYSEVFVQAGSTTGSRYFLNLPAFELIARHRFEATQGESERVMGDQQERWFIKTLKNSKATWKFWGNEYTLMRKVLDLSGLTGLPPAFQYPLLVSADDWDGMPNRRRGLLEQLKEVTNLVAVTGDIHSFFTGQVDVDPERPLLEFVCGAVSSATLQSALESGEYDLGEFSSLARFAGALLLASNPHVRYGDVATNGFASFTVDEAELNVTFHLLDYQHVEQPDPDPLTFRRQRFRVSTGSDELELLDE